MSNVNKARPKQSSPRDNNNDSSPIMVEKPKPQQAPRRRRRQTRAHKKAINNNTSTSNTTTSKPTIPALLGPWIDNVAVKLWELQPINPLEYHANPLARFWIFRQSLVFAPLKTSDEQARLLAHYPLFAAQNSHAVAISVVISHVRHAYSRNPMEVINQVYAIQISYKDMTDTYLCWFPVHYVTTSGPRNNKTIMQATSDRHMIQWAHNNKMPVPTFATAVADLHQRAQTSPKHYFDDDKMVVPKTILHAPVLVLDEKLVNVSPMIRHEYSNDCWRQRSLYELCHQHAAPDDDAANDDQDDRVTKSIIDYIAGRCYPTYHSYMSPVYGAWDQHQVLGKGHFGTVIKIPWRNSKTGRMRQVVVKLTNSGIEQTDVEGTVGEAAVGKLFTSAVLTPEQLQIIRHHTVRILGWTNYGVHFGLVMEYVNGVNLKQWVAREEAALKKIKAVSARYQKQVAVTFLILNMLTDIVRVLSVLHERLGYVHRDIKPENILVGKHNKAKLIDFGMMAPMGYYVGYAATRRYALPEIVAMKEKMDKGQGLPKIMHTNGAVDLYSVGVMLAKWTDRDILVLPESLETVVSDLVSAKKRSDIELNAKDLIHEFTRAATHLLNHREKDELVVQEPRHKNNNHKPPSPRGNHGRRSNNNQ